MGNEKLCNPAITKPSLPNTYSNKAVHLHHSMIKSIPCSRIIINNYKNPQFNVNYSIGRSNTFRQLSNF